jgi:predicted dehydrogenase
MDKKTAGGGPLFDIGIHCLDSMRFVLNDDNVQTVKSLMTPDHSTGNVEKTSVLSLQFSRGTLATIYSSYVSSYRQGFIEFFGTKGSISAYQFTPSNVDAVLELKFGKEGNLENIKKENIHVPDLYKREIEHFSDCILNGTNPVIENTSSLHNQEILDLAVDNAKK